MCSRGVDIRGADWVVSFDCPEDVNAYIHRVGRTARYKSAGFALLLLLPSEQRMVGMVRNAKVPIVRVKAKIPQKAAEGKWALSSRFASFLAESEELKYTAQKAFVGYVRAVNKSSDKGVSFIVTVTLTSRLILIRWEGVRLVENRSAQTLRGHGAG